MKRLLALLLAALAALAASAVQAGTVSLTTISIAPAPSILFPSSGNPVPVGSSTDVTITLSKGSSTALLSAVNLLPGTDYQLVGGNCAQGTTAFINAGDNCTIQVRFTPTTTGTRTGTLQLDCQPFVPPGGVVFVCDNTGATFASLALSGVAAAVAASLPVPALGRYEITALALTLFALAGWSLRRKP